MNILDLIYRYDQWGMRQNHAGRRNNLRISTELGWQETQNFSRIYGARPAHAPCMACPDNEPIMQILHKGNLAELKLENQTRQSNSNNLTKINS